LSRGKEGRKVSLTHNLKQYCDQHRGVQQKIWGGKHVQEMYIYGDDTLFQTICKFLPDNTAAYAMLLGHCSDTEPISYIAFLRVCCILLSSLGTSDRNRER
jgi:hypothetical protein